MILMEPIKGRVMTEVKPHGYPEAVRLDALVKIMEALVRVSFGGVNHGDISQRNIMLCDDDAAETVERVVIVDFNFAVVRRLDNFEEEFGCPRTEVDNPGKPRNPIDDWWDGGLYGGFLEWPPARWEFRLRPMQEWMYERWSESPEYEAPTEPDRCGWDEENEPRMWLCW